MTLLKRIAFCLFAGTLAAAPICASADGAPGLAAETGTRAANTPLFAPAISPEESGGGNADAVPASAAHKVEGGRYDVLSRHDTEAIFAGTRTQVCHGRTMLCPDKCGGSGTLAAFRIVRYNAYEQRSQYGDPRAETFEFMLEATTGKSDVAPEIAARVRSLAAGTRVRLVWEHIYHTDPRGSKFPERVVREISPLPEAAPASAPENSPESVPAENPPQNPPENSPEKSPRGA